MRPAAFGAFAKNTPAPQPGALLPKKHRDSFTITDLQKCKNGCFGNFRGLFPNSHRNCVIMSEETKRYEEQELSTA